jgi:hypothetical protein
MSELIFSLDIENLTITVNEIKEKIVAKLITEEYLDIDEGKEFIERCQIIVHRGTWFNRWFNKNMKGNKIDKFYFSIVDMGKKESKLERLLNETTSSYDENEDY